MSKDSSNDKGKVGDKAAFLRTALSRYEKARDAERDNRKLALDDLRFLNGEQWPEKIKEKRKKEGRPCLTVNRLPGFVDQVVGDQRQNRPRIKVRPVDSGSDPELARVYEGLIRNIEYISHAEAVYDHAFESAVNCGTGYFRVMTEYADETSFEQEIRIRRVTNPFAVYMDPSADEVDYSDAMWGFFVERMPREEFERKYPGVPLDGWEEDTEQSDWITEDEVQVAEYFERKAVTKKIVLLSDGRGLYEDQATPEALAVLSEEAGAPVSIVRERETTCYEVSWHKITAREVLEGPNPWPGKYIPIVPVIGKELFIEGKCIRRGLVRHAKDPQRMYNFWRTAVTELVALSPKAPWILTTKQLGNHKAMWDTANVKPWPYLLYEPDPAAGAPPQRQFPAQLPQGAFTEAQVAVDDMKATTGIFDASLGNRSNETSGKAIIARQREGDVATFAFIDNLSRSIAQNGRILVDLIPHIYDTERAVRILNPDETDEEIVINQVTDEGIANDMKAGKYDVVVETGPSYSTQRVESADSMVKFVQAVPDSAPAIADLIAKNMDWPGADELAKRLRRMLPPGIAEPEEGEEPPPPPQPTPEQQLEAKKLEVEAARVEVERQKVLREGEDLEARIRQVVLDTMSEVYNPTGGEPTPGT